MTTRNAGALALAVLALFGALAAHFPAGPSPRANQLPDDVTGG